MKGKGAESEGFWRAKADAYAGGGFELASSESDSL